jgi:hypothetical protein
MARTRMTRIATVEWFPFGSRARMRAREPKGPYRSMSTW